MGYAIVVVVEDEGARGVWRLGREVDAGRDRRWRTGRRAGRRVETGLPARDGLGVTSCRDAIVQVSVNGVAVR